MKNTEDNPLYIYVEVVIKSKLYKHIYALNMFNSWLLIPQIAYVPATGNKLGKSEMLKSTTSPEAHLYGISSNIFHRKFHMKL